LSTKEAILLAETCLKLGYDAISAIRVGSTYNIMGWRYRNMWNLVDAGQNKAAFQIQSKCNEVIDLLAAGGVFPSIKFILHKMNIIRTPNCRMPLGKVPRLWWRKKG
jgi:dihydrodipicolinate synthase/N-acetylneuraminate lyase